MIKNKKIALMSCLSLMFSTSFFADGFTSAVRDVGVQALDQGYSNAVNNVSNSFVENGTRMMDNISRGVEGRLNKTKNMNELMGQKTPNAYQQGLGKEKISQDLINELKETQKQANNARQLGIQVDVAHIAKPVGKNKKDNMLVKNWIMMLKDVGVSEEKTRFEASRLDKDEFIEWASSTYNGLKNR